MFKNAFILFGLLSLTPLFISAQKSSKNAEAKKAAIVASNPQPYTIYNSVGEMESFNSIVEAALETPGIKEKHCASPIIKDCR